MNKQIGKTHVKKLHLYIDQNINNFTKNINSNNEVSKARQKTKRLKSEIPYGSSVCLR